MTDRTVKFDGRQSDEYNNALRIFGTHRLLTNQEVRDLVGRIRQGDDSAIWELICSNMRLILDRAKRWAAWRGISVGDLIGETIIALATRIRSYNPKLGAFSTWAIPVIDQVMHRVIAKNLSNIKIPLLLANALMQSGNTHLDNCVTISSDTQNDYGNGKSLLDFVTDPEAIMPDQFAIDQECNQVILAAINRLPEHLKIVMKAHYFEDLDFQQIGRQLGITKAAVRQRHQRAIELLKNQLSPNGLSRKAAY